MKNTLLVLFALWLTASAHAGDYRIEVSLRTPETSTTVITYDVKPETVAAVQSDVSRRDRFERRARRDYAEQHGYSRKVYGKENYKLINGLYIQAIRVVAPGTDKEIYRHPLHRTGQDR